MSAPYSYADEMMMQGRYSPSTVRVHDNASTGYFRRYLYQMAMSVFRWTAPETWDVDYLLYTLYATGCVALIRSDKYGVIPQQASPGGFNIFRRPAWVTIANAADSSLSGRYTIGRDCVLLKLQPDLGGIGDMVEYYATRMALATEALDTNLINSKLGVVFAAEKKSTAEALKKVYDKLSSGEPAVFADPFILDDNGKPHWQPFLGNVKQLYIGEELLRTQNTLTERFLREIGIPTANEDKRERLTDDEVHQGDVQASTRAEMWLDCIRRGAAEAAELWPDDPTAKFTVDWRRDPHEREPVDNGTPDGEA